MTRRRWLKADWPFGISELAARLRAVPYSTSSNSGFILDKVRPELIEGRFIERLEISETIESPFGERTEFERLEYIQTQFVASTTRAGLELRSAPRSINFFLSSLSQACDFKLAVSGLKTDVVAWAREVMDEIDDSAVISTVAMRQIELGYEKTASATVKGVVDVLEYSKSFVGERSYNIERIKIEIPRKPKISFTLNSQASLSSNHELNEEIVSSVRNGLGRVSPYV